MKKKRTNDMISDLKGVYHGKDSNKLEDIHFNDRGICNNYFNTVHIFNNKVKNVTTGTT